MHRLLIDARLGRPMRASVAQVAWRGVIWSSGKQRPPSGRSERYPQAPVGLLRALIERDQHALVGVSFKRDQPVIACAPEHASAGKRLEEPTAVGLWEPQRRGAEAATEHVCCDGRGHGEPRWQPGQHRVRLQHDVCGERGNALERSGGRVVFLVPCR